MIDALPLLLGDDGYQISRSVRLRSSATAFLTRTPASAGSQTTWTMSMWVKRGALGVRQFITMSGTNPNSSQVWQVEFDANNKLDFFNQAIGTYRRTTQVFRDVGAWYHIVFGADTNNATAQNRFRCWVNGVEVTAWDVNSTISSGYTFAYNGAYLHGIGAYTYSGNGLPLDGYLTDINFIDGQALTPAAFGETDAITGVWKPRRYTGTYGTNGFFLNFSDPSAATAAAIGADRSGNGNNWTPNNISVTAGVTYDSMLDVPTPWADGGNGRGNYCTLNPLDKFGTATTAAANLECAPGTNGVWNCLAGTIAVSSGKYYWEYYATQTAVLDRMVGICSVTDNLSVGFYPGQSAASYGYYSVNGQKYNNGTGAAYGATYQTAGDVIGVALDLDAGTLTFYKNNVSQGVAFTGISGTFKPAFSFTNTGNSHAVNFGQRPFAYTPPTGFRALNTQNLPEPTIVRGNRFMDATTYTGTGAARSVTNAGSFQPDLVWMKDRGNVVSHILFDAQRGTDNFLRSNTTDAATTNTTLLTAFNSNGFSLGTDSAGAVNVNGNNYIAWQWREGATQGFDIVTYTGTGANRTVAHSLGVAPRMMIVKSRTTASGWAVYHGSIAATNYLLLESTAASAAGTTVWNSTAPTSSVFSVGTDGSVNGSTRDYVAYLFSEVAGFSRFGSYTGNGSADGPFVFCGFRPRWIMIKRTDSADNWFIYDTARSSNNATNNQLIADSSVAEGTGGNYNDILSNGFKIRETNSGRNASGGTYIFAAFAETPQKFSLAR